MTASLRTTRLALLASALVVVASNVACPSSIRPCNDERDCFGDETCYIGRCTLLTCNTDCPDDRICECIDDDDDVDAGSPIEDAGVVDEPDAGNGDVDAGTADAGNDVDAGPVEPWREASLTHRRRLEVDTSTLNGSIDLPAPLLIALDSSILPPDTASVDCGDMRILDETGATLPIDFQRCSPASKTLLWTSLSEIDDDTGRTVLWLYWGGAQQPPAGGSTWPTYSSVFHFESPDQASSAGDDRQPASNDPRGALGIVGNALSIESDASSPEVNGGDFDDYDVVNNGVITASTWLRANADDTDRQLLYKNDACLGWQISMSPQGNLVGYVSGSGCDALYQDDVTASAPGFDDERWHHVALVVDDAAHEIELYVDGAVTSTSSIAIDGAIDGPGPLRFGHRFDRGELFLGRLDEVSVTNERRSPTRIAWEYATMTEQLVTFGAHETIAGDVVPEVPAVTDGYDNDPEGLGSLLAFPLDVRILDGNDNRDRVVRKKDMTGPVIGKRATVIATTLTVHDALAADLVVLAVDGFDNERLVEVVVDADRRLHARTTAALGGIDVTFGALGVDAGVIGTEPVDVVLSIPADGGSLSLTVAPLDENAASATASGALPSGFPARGYRYLVAGIDRYDATPGAAVRVTQTNVTTTLGP